MTIAAMVDPATSPAAMRHEAPLEEPLLGARPVRCGVCGAEFPTRERLDEHTRLEHQQS